MRLKDKVAIITGAASGMGASTAKIFADEGAKVIVTDLTVKEGDAVANAITVGGGEARFLKLDVASEADWKCAVSETNSAYGRIDILINNAGISGSHPDQLNTKTWDEQMNIYAKGAFLGMQAVIPIMQKAGRGSIVNISSISGFVGQAYVHMGYSGSKGAVRLMTKSAAIQYAESGIRVNSVHPGVMPPMTTSEMTADPEFRKIMLQDVPMNRVGLVEEVANAVLFLASDDASYITGAELPVDGGLTAR